MSVQFPDVSSYHPITDGPKACSSGIIAIAGRRNSGEDPSLKANLAKVPDNTVVIIYTAEGTVSGGVAYQRLKSSAPWRPGYLYCADIESFGMNASQGRAFTAAARADGRGSVGYSIASDPAFGADFRWLAEWGPSSAPRGADIWQFADGVVGKKPHSWPGVSGNCDMNELTIDLVTLRQAAGLEDNMTKDDIAKLFGFNSGQDMEEACQAGRALRLRADGSTSEPADADVKGPFDYLGTLGGGGGAVPAHSHTVTGTAK